MSENPLLDIVETAHPLLEQLKASKTNLESYAASAQNYATLAAQEKAKIDALMVQLKGFAGQFVAAYIAGQEAPQ